MTWLLIMQLTYSTPYGIKISTDDVEGFQTEKACLSYAIMQDKHLKKIKSQTNLKSWDLMCVKGD